MSIKKFFYRTFLFALIFVFYMSSVHITNLFSDNSNRFGSPNYNNYTNYKKNSKSKPTDNYNYASYSSGDKNYSSKNLFQLFSSANAEEDLSEKKEEKPPTLVDTIFIDQFSTEKVLFGFNEQEAIERDSQKPKTLPQKFVETDESAKKQSEGMSENLRKQYEELFKMLYGFSRPFYYEEPLKNISLQNLTPTELPSIYVAENKKRKTKTFYYVKKDKESLSIHKLKEAFAGLLTSYRKTFIPGMYHHDSPDKMRERPFFVITGKKGKENYTKEIIPFHYDPSNPIFSPKKINKINTIKANFNHFPGEVVRFYSAIFVTTYSLFFTRFAHDPIAFQHFKEMCFSVVGYISFHNFTLASNFASQILINLYRTLASPKTQALSKINYFVKFVQPFFTLGIGHLASTMTSELLHDPLIKRCALGILTAKEEEEGKGLTGSECQEAFQRWTSPEKQKELGIDATSLGIASLLSGGVQLSFKKLNQKFTPNGLFNELMKIAKSSELGNKLVKFRGFTVRTSVLNFFKNIPNKFKGSKIMKIFAPQSVFSFGNSLIFLFAIEATDHLTKEPLRKFHESGRVMSSYNFIKKNQKILKENRWSMPAIKSHPYLFKDFENVMKEKELVFNEATRENYMKTENFQHLPFQEQIQYTKNYHQERLLERDDNNNIDIFNFCHLAYIKKLLDKEEDENLNFCKTIKGNVAFNNYISKYWRLEVLLKEFYQEYSSFTDLWTKFFSMYINTTTFYDYFVKERQSYQKLYQSSGSLLESRLLTLSLSPIVPLDGVKDTQTNKFIDQKSVALGHTAYITEGQRETIRETTEWLNEENINRYLGRPSLFDKLTQGDTDPNRIFISNLKKMLSSSDSFTIGKGLKTLNRKIDQLEDKTSHFFKYDTTKMLKLLKLISHKLGSPTPRLKGDLFLNAFFHNTDFQDLYTQENHPKNLDLMQTKNLTSYLVASLACGPDLNEAFKYKNANTFWAKRPSLNPPKIIRSEINDLCTNGQYYSKNYSQTKSNITDPGSLDPLNVIIEYDNKTYDSLLHFVIENIDPLFLDPNKYENWRNKFDDHFKKITDIVHDQYNQLLRDLFIPVFADEEDDKTRVHKAPKRISASLEQELNLYLSLIEDLYKYQKESNELQIIDYFFFKDQETKELTKKQLAQLKQKTFSDIYPIQKSPISQLPFEEFFRKYDFISLDSLPISLLKDQPMIKVFKKAIPNYISLEYLPDLTTYVSQDIGPYNDGVEPSDNPELNNFTPKGIFIDDNTGQLYAVNLTGDIVAIETQRQFPRLKRQINVLKANLPKSDSEKALLLAFNELIYDQMPIILENIRLNFSRMLTNIKYSILHKNPENKASSSKHVRERYEELTIQTSMLKYFLTVDKNELFATLSKMIPLRTENFYFRDLTVMTLITKIQNIYDEAKTYHSSYVEAGFNFETNSYTPSTPFEYSYMFNKKYQDSYGEFIKSMEQRGVEDFTNNNEQIFSSNEADIM